MHGVHEACSIGTKAGGCVPYVEIECPARVPTGEVRKHASSGSPVSSVASWDVARSDRKVGFSGEGMQQRGDVCRVMREVGVHLDEHVISRCDTEGEAGAVRM